MPGISFEMSGGAFHAFYLGWIYRGWDGLSGPGRRGDALMAAPLADGALEVGSAAVAMDVVEAEVGAAEGEALQEHKIVRSGIVFNPDQEERRRENVKRAVGVKQELGAEPLTGIEGRLAYRFIKRAFDIAFSAVVMVAFCWLFAIIAIAIKIDDPKGPVIFKQQRVGKNGKTFNMYKFRTMCVDAEEKLASLRELNEKTGPVFKIAADPRVTRVGKWLRKLSLACVIIGTPGDGESTKPLSHATKTSLDQQFSERRPEFASRVWAHYTSPEFLSSGLFGGFTGSLFGGFIRGKRRFITGSLFATLSMLAAPATAKAVSV